MAEILEASGAGSCVEAGNVDALVQEIERVYKAKIHKSNLRAYVQDHADRRICVAQYLNTVL